VGINVLGLEQVQDSGSLDFLCLSVDFNLHESTQLGLQTGEFPHANKQSVGLSRSGNLG
jgi:hypothetical protein